MAERSESERGAARRRLDTASLAVGYALSRLDRGLLESLGFRSWNQAYEAFGRALGVPPRSIKGLRDEFDPLHANARRGWVNRPMVANRVRVADELQLVSDDALVELSRLILARRDEATREALDVLVPPHGLAAAAAERLATGRKAEEYLLANCHRILGADRRMLRDARDDLAGFDFELRTAPSIFVEVKGLRVRVGEILFTDREWREARRRRDRYWLVVVGNLAQRPEHELVKHPASRLFPSCRFERALRSSWVTRFELGSAAGASRVAEGDGGRDRDA